MSNEKEGRGKGKRKKEKKKHQTGGGRGQSARKGVTRGIGKGTDRRRRRNDWQNA